MVKVIVRKASTGVAAASTLLVATGGGSLGCAADALAPEPEAEPITEADLAVSAGAAVLGLDYQFGQGVEFGLSVRQSTTDEFIRVGEKLTLSIPGWLLWQELYPQDPLPDAARQKKLKGSIQIRFYDKAANIGSATTLITTYNDVGPSDIDAISDPFTIPSKVDSIKMVITISDGANPGVSAQIPAASINTVPVFGGELPKKTLFFDSVAAKLRQRIIEGDGIVSGSSMRLSYTEWRADTLVDKTSIDTQIGKAQTPSRFGMVVVPIYGKLVHEVSYSVLFNDGLGWRPEAPLAATMTTPVLAPGRMAFEADVPIPGKASKMSLYLHVKSYVVADYSGYTNITEKWFANNEKVLKVDKYDNPFGPFTNYDFSLQH